MADSIIQQAISTGSSPTKLTVSMWIKGMADKATTTQRSFFGFRDNADTDRFFNFYMSSNQSLYTYWKDSSTVFTLGTTQKFIDPTAWGHFVLTMDTTLGTAADRVKMFWNGTRLTSFEDGLDTITQNKTMDLLENTDGKTTIGAAKTGSTWHYWDGCISHVHYTDGFAYEADTFGETDSTSGIWKIKSSPSVSYGTNGFFMLKNDASLNDDSGNGFTFTVESGSVQPVLDSPSNNFATFSEPATTNNRGDTVTFTNGHTTITNTGGGGWQPLISTLAAKKGKWYAEFKCATIGGASKYGIIDPIQYVVQVNWASATRGYGYEYNEGAFVNGASNWDNSWSGITNFTTNDIIGVAMDLDNMKLYFSKNGTWLQSADPTSGATGTGTMTYFGGGSNTANASGVDYYAFTANIHNSSVTNANFGNGYFGKTAVASVNADDNGVGTFEYDVPAGYYALCTKNLASYGG